MATLLNPSKNSFVGPWLLNIQSLEELDEIVQYADESLKNSRVAFLKSEGLDGSKEKYIRKNITLISHDESKLKDESIKELLVDPKIKNFKPKELNIDIGYGLETRHERKNMFSLNVKQRYDGELDYSVKSTQPEVEDELNYKLENWVDKYKPMRVKSFWLKFSFFFIFLGASIALISYSYISTTYTPSSSIVYQDQIQNIIQSGVNENNYLEAIELILKVNTGYIPDDIKTEVRINRTAKSICIFSTAIFLIGLFKPKTLIGVGKHKNLLKFYKGYMQLVLFIIPGIFIYPYIIDYIKSLL